MGLSSMTTISEGMQLCIFDLRRGQHEGQELDKILFFFPSECPYSMQLSAIGLSEGIITFARIFSPEAACETIEAERHSHMFYQPEPDIWMIMHCLHFYQNSVCGDARDSNGSLKLNSLQNNRIVDKKNDTESVWSYDALQKILKEVHSLFVMFHGSLRYLLEKEPNGELARSLLYTFVMDYLGEFHIGKKMQMPSYRDCLKERGTVQMLTVSREVAIEVQSLITLIASSTIGSTICNTLVLFQDLLVSTTLSPDDTANMYTYSVLRLTPHALSSNTSTWSYLRKVTSTGNAAAISSIRNTGSASEVSHETSSDTSSGESSRNYHFPRPLQRDRWSKGNDGFVTADIGGAEVGNSISITPTVLLQQTEEWMYLCIYQHKNLTIVLLIPVGSLINGEKGISFLKKQLIENASQKIMHIEEKLSRGWGGENAYHVSGYRYLLIDNDRSISRASPPGKVTTLTKDSLLALNKLRVEVDLEKARVKREDPEHENDLEVCIRAKNNAWIVGRLIRGKELYMVLEKANETLLYASDAVEKFSDRYCDGSFSLN